MLRLTRYIYGKSRLQVRAGTFNWLVMIKRVTGVDKNKRVKFRDFVIRVC